MTPRIGTSGYVYKHWRGVVYPQELKSSEWLRYYATLFDTVEINNSFYHLLKAPVVRDWRATVPHDFLFAVKGSRYVTHMRKLNEPAAPLQRFMAPIRELGPHLGPLLFQLPPHWGVNLERLEGLLAWFRHRRVRLVLEFRDPAWYNVEVYRIMDRYRASICLHDMEGSANDAVLAGPVVYVRRHGPGLRYAGSYSDEELRALAGRVMAWTAEGREVYVYFNNDLHGYAVRNALTLKGFL